MSLTTDPNSECLVQGQKETGQNDCYLILSDEERAAGFVRPVRESYVHVGRKPTYKGIHRMLSVEEKLAYLQDGKKYVAIMTVLEDENGSFKGGSYVTQEEVDAWREGKVLGGCGAETRMHLSIAETYAKNPEFYGATFCTKCGKHFPVAEFVWSNTNETVGS